MRRRTHERRLVLRGAAGSRSRARRAGRGRHDRRRGVALIIAITAITILTVVLADFHETTGTHFAIATSAREEVRAEFMARSGLNLTRLLVQREPQIRATVAPLYQALIGRPPPMLPVWSLANEVLKPFCDFEGSRGLQTGIDLGSAQGLDGTDAGCEIVAFAENSKINVNLPLNFAGDQARRSLSMQLFAMTGGYQAPSPFDPLFQQRDRDGQLTSRIDAIGALIDWWDYDTDRTVFDPGRSQVSASGSEDDLYQRLPDPYRGKNAPLDSLEELRMVRGVGDDFWATFVEPRPEDPEARTLTIYGSGLVNVNEGPPEVLLARLCSFLEGTTLCADPLEAAKFIQLTNTARQLIPVPFFTRVSDFLNFVEGRGGARDLYPMLQGFLGQQSPLLFTPISIPASVRAEIDNSFVTAARIFTIQVTGQAGCRERDPTGYCVGGWKARTRLNTIMNFHDRWTPPPPNAGRMPGLGIFHYYRVD